MLYVIFKLEILAMPNKTTVLNIKIIAVVPRPTAKPETDIISRSEEVVINTVDLCRDSGTGGGGNSEVEVYCCGCVIS